jgi:L-Ala-D/L-Glu epimerase
VKITRISSVAVTVPVGFFQDGQCKVRFSKGWEGRGGHYTHLRPVVNDTLHLDYVIVKIETDEGIAGTGDAIADIGFFGETAEGVKALIDKYLGPPLIGKDPYDREVINSEIQGHAGWNPSARSGIDLAIHDLLGKAMNIPVSSLIGGRHQDKVLAAIEVPRGSPEEMAAHSKEYVDQGIMALKAKIGGASGEADAKKLLAIRNAVGAKVSLRADANQGYTPKEAIEFCKKTKEYGVGLELLEQPVPRWDLDGMAQIKNAVDTLIEADESAFSPQDVMNIVKKKAADVINVKISKAGGLYNAKKIAAMAEAADLQCVIGTEWGLGLRVASKLHLAASTINIKDAVEFTEIMIHDLLSAPFPLENGCLTVPKKPGLGIELDEHKVRQNMLKIGKS